MRLWRKGIPNDEGRQRYSNSHCQVVGSNRHSKERVGEVDERIESLQHMQMCSVVFTVFCRWANGKVGTVKCLPV